MTDTSGDELLAQKWADYFEGAPDDHAAVAINIPAQRAEIVSALRIAAQRPSPSGDGLRDAAETALKFIESQMSYSQPAHDMGEEPSDQFTYDAVPVVMDLQKALVPTDTFDLHSYTRDLVSRFATALSEKLSRSEKKYGYSDNWADPTWQAECQKEFRQHVAKGDPIDVAAFCAFMWHHGWPIVATTTPSDNGESGSERNSACIEGSSGTYAVPLSDLEQEMLEALKGVVRVADRKTVEFDAAHAAIAKAENQ